MVHIPCIRCRMVVSDDIEVSKDDPWDMTVVVKQTGD